MTGTVPRAPHRPAPFTARPLIIGGRSGAPIQAASLVPSNVKVTAPPSRESRLLTDAREGLVSPLVVKKYQSLTTCGVRLKEVERMAKVPR